jgi:hypothetical protein
MDWGLKHYPPSLKYAWALDDLSSPLLLFSLHAGGLEPLFLGVCLDWGPHPINESINGLTNGWMDGWMDGLFECSIIGMLKLSNTWLGGWMDG